MGKIKWATTKFFSYPTKDIKEFRNYLKFALKDLINHENVFSEYLLSVDHPQPENDDASATTTILTERVANSQENKNQDEFIPSAVLGTELAVASPLMTMPSCLLSRLFPNEEFRVINPL
jgi:hypothetical protein